MPHTLTSPIPDRFLWLDGEFTGLDPEKDQIMEMAGIATDPYFHELDTYESFVAGDTVHIESLIDANPWWHSRPEHKQVMLDGVREGQPLAQVEAALINLVDTYCGDQPAILAGNSIRQDRNMIEAHMPDLDARLHYRMIDVSSFKVVVLAWHGEEFPKQEAHRALSDIRESIDEIKFCLQKIGGSALNLLS